MPPDPLTIPNMVQEVASGSPDFSAYGVRQSEEGEATSNLLLTSSRQAVESSVVYIAVRSSAAFRVIEKQNKVEVPHGPLRYHRQVPHHVLGYKGM